jgi:nucleotide-binding universal stress UspA family protein
VVNSAPCPVVVVPPDSAAAVTLGPAAVVAGVDGSSAACEALATAADLAHGLGSELVAVHVEPAPVPLTDSAGGMPMWPRTVWDPARRAARRTVERAVDALDTELPVRIRCDIGDPAERLSTVATEQPSAILVVASRGHGRLRSALLGSVSARLCASAPVPVVVVPHGAARPRLDTSRAGTAPAAAEAIRA